jgi:UDP-glucose 4-epimerase
MVVPRFVEAALKNESIPVHGNGTQSRVFCHVEDVVRAVLGVIADDTTIGQVFNVGGVGETTIQQLAEKIISQTNSKSTISYSPYSEAYPPGYEDMQRRVPDVSKLEKWIKWTPSFSIEEIIQSVTDSHRIPHAH